jgi:UDP-2-acetamido-2-deoxy-ribo-hexuluronate aminotransferase
MDTLQAAILLAKLDRFPEEVEARDRIGRRYTEAFARACPAVMTPYIEPHNTSVYAQYTLQVNGREEFIERLKASGVPTAIHYPVPLHLQPAFGYLDVKKSDLPVSERAAERVVSLPMHPYLETGVQDEIIRAVCDATIR